MVLMPASATCRLDSQRATISKFSLALAGLSTAALTLPYIMHLHCSQSICQLQDYDMPPATAQASTVRGSQAGQHASGGVHSSPPGGAGGAALRCPFKEGCPAGSRLHPQQQICSPQWSQGSLPGIPAPAVGQGGAGLVP